MNNKKGKTKQFLEQENFICFPIYAEILINHVWEISLESFYANTFLTRCIAVSDNEIFYHSSWHNSRVFILSDCIIWPNMFRFYTQSFLSIADSKADSQFNSCCKVFNWAATILPDSPRNLEHAMIVINRRCFIIIKSVTRASPEFKSKTCETCLSSFISPSWNCFLILTLLNRISNQFEKIASMAKIDVLALSDFLVFPSTSFCLSLRAFDSQSNTENRNTEMMESIVDVVAMNCDAAQNIITFWLVLL